MRGPASYSIAQGGLCLAIHRSGEGPPLVLLPANGGDARDFAAAIPRLSRRFTVHAVD